MLRFIDGFDHSPSAVLKHATKYLSGSFPGFVTGRSGSGYAADFTNATLVSRGLGSSGATCVIGVAIKSTDPLYWGPTSQILRVQEGIGGPVHATIGVNSSGQLKVYRGTSAGTVLGTSSYAMITNRWYYLEFKVVIGASGSFEARLDGSNKVSASGVNTQNGGSGTWDRFIMSAWMNGSTTCFVDDLYALDGVSGDGCTSFLGDRTVITRVAKTDVVSAGSNADWTPNTGTDHGALVNEATPDDDTTYVHGDTASLKDSYKWNAFSPTGAIAGLQISVYLKQVTAGARQINTLVRVGGTDYDHPDTFDAPSGYEYRSQMFSTNPATSSPWIDTEVDNVAAERGIKIAS